MGKSRLLNRRRQDQGSKWARITIAILSTIGVIDTGSITLNRWGVLSPLSCPGGYEGCDTVLNSPWGTLTQINNIEIPLSLLGLGSYLFILILAILPLFTRFTENKNSLSRKTWWGLFATSCCMTVFSMILIWLMLFKIEAFCFFCLLSGFISVSLLLLSIIGGGWDDSGQLFFRGIILSLVVLLGGLIWSSNVDPSRVLLATENIGFPPIVESVSTPNQVALAKHLTKEKAIMYSAYWCPHCHDQKEMFGKSASKELLIVECAIDGKNNQRSLCESKGITGFPSWEINGIIESGVRTLQDLADLTNFKGPKNF